jgi:hypothetical protein
MCDCQKNGSQFNSFYNEYTDGRRIPIIYENFSAAKDLAKWALGTK